MRKTRVFPPSNLKKPSKWLFLPQIIKDLFFLFLLYVTFVFCQKQAKKETSGWIIAFLVVILGYQRPSPKTTHQSICICMCSIIVYSTMNTYWKLNLETMSRRLLRDHIYPVE